VTYKVTSELLGKVKVRVKLFLSQAVEAHKVERSRLWVLGLCPSSGIVEIGKYNVSETGSVSVLR
jgi:hypothetical protein